MHNSNELQSKVIDWLRFPLMVMVVMIHTSLCRNVDYSLPITEMSVSAIVHYIFASGICFAAVPTFFFISGFLFFSGLKENTPPSWNYYASKYKKRFKSLLIPFVIATLTFLLCHYGLEIIRALHSGGSMPSIVDILNKHGWLRIFWDNNRIAEASQAPRTNIIGMTMHSNFPMLSPMWFLRDLIVVVLLSPLVYWIVTKTKKVGLCIMGILYVLNIWIPLEGFSALAFFFFSFGAYMRINKLNVLDEFQKFKYPCYFIALAALLMMLVAHSYNDLLEGIFVRTYIVAGVVSFFNIARCIVVKNKFKMPSILSNSSFFVYLTHNMYINGIVGLLVAKVLPFNNQLVFILNYFITVALTSAVCVLLYAIMQRWCPKVLSVVSGGR